MTADSPTAVATRPSATPVLDPAPDERPAPRRRRRSSRALAAGLIVLAALVGALTWSTWARERARTDTTEAVAAQPAVRQALADAERRIEERRAAHARAEAELDALVQDLGLRSSERDELWGSATEAHRELDELTFLADVRAGTVLEQGAHLADLRACLRAAEQALALTSTGSAGLGRRILDDSTGACERAEAYLEGRDAP